MANILISLPRELRDEIISYLVLPGFVYTSSAKPDTQNLHRGPVPASTFVDTRIYLPSRIVPNALAVCRQLREECLQYHTHVLNSIPLLPSPPEDADELNKSHILAARLGNEHDDEAERLGDCGLRVTLEAQRGQKGQFGYFQPVREDLSPRFMALLPFLKQVKALRLVVWPGLEWWTGSRPRAMRRVNGRLKLVDADDEENAGSKPDAVSFAIGKVLEQLPAVEELHVDVMSYVGDFTRGDISDCYWEKIKYWLDGPVAPTEGENLRIVSRHLSAVWYAKRREAFYVQEEVKKDEKTWFVKRKGDMITKTVLALAEPGELDNLGKTIEEEFERTV